MEFIRLAKCFNEALSILYRHPVLNPIKLHTLYIRQLGSHDFRHFVRPGTKLILKLTLCGVCVCMRVWRNACGNITGAHVPAIRHTISPWNAHRTRAPPNAAARRKIENNWKLGWPRLKLANAPPASAPESCADGAPVPRECSTIIIDTRPYECLHSTYFIMINVLLISFPSDVVRPLGEHSYDKMVQCSVSHLPLCVSHSPLRFSFAFATGDDEKLIGNYSNALDLFDEVLCCS